MSYLQAKDYRVQSRFYAVRQNTKSTSTMLTSASTFSQVGQSPVSYQQYQPSNVGRNFEQGGLPLQGPYPYMCNRVVPVPIDAFPPPPCPFPQVEINSAWTTSTSTISPQSQCHHFQLMQPVPARFMSAESSFVFQPVPGINGMTMTVSMCQSQSPVTLLSPQIQAQCQPTLIACDTYNCNCIHQHQNPILNPSYEGEYRPYFQNPSLPSFQSMDHIKSQRNFDHAQREQQVNGLEYENRVAGNCESQGPSSSSASCRISEEGNENKFNKSRFTNSGWRNKKGRKNPRGFGYCKKSKEELCIFCRSNGESASMFNSHVLKDKDNKTICPVLMKYVCPICKKTGEDAHTVKYCPMVNVNKNLQRRIYKHVRNASGGFNVLKY